MGLGIAISMFTAVSIVRVIMTALVRRLRPKQLRIEPLIRLFPDGTNIRFMRARFIGIGLSAVLSVASLPLFVKPGLNYGVDFRGGIQVEVATSRPTDLAALRSKLSTLELGEVTLQDFGNASNVLVRVQRQPGDDAAQLTAVQKVKAAIAEVDPGARIQRTEVVGPKVR